ncbi:hypothetical protein AB4Z35_04565 [Pseudomonas sp. KB_15]|uniref:hypothetical protein n=1 Tax=Pseudomonas sp. KB_15 TaxID=3233035 RepID=UPI003F9E41C8
MTQIVDDVQAVLAKLSAEMWWQGSLIHQSEISDLVTAYGDCEWWVVASQPCNIYSDDFTAVPVVELIGASAISELTEYATGFHPREIHLAAHHGADELLIRVDSQKRVWMPRSRLMDLPPPPFRLENRHTQPFSSQTLWLDKFSSWLARGYTRAALPDDFNRILAKSKIRDVLEARLAKRKHDELFGIFLTITAEQDSPNQEIGLLEPPYDLGILVACYEDIEPEPLQAHLVKQLFSDEVKDPEAEGAFITRSDLAKRLGIRIIKADVEVKSVSSIALIELLGKNTVRYNLVDFHSVAGSSQI